MRRRVRSRSSSNSGIVGGRGYQHQRGVERPYGALWGGRKPNVGAGGFPMRWDQKGIRVEKEAPEIAGSPGLGPPFIVKTTLLAVWVWRCRVSAFSKTRFSPLAEPVEQMRILIHHANGNDTRKEHPIAARIAFFPCDIRWREFGLPKLSPAFQFRATDDQDVLATNYFSGVPPNCPTVLRGPRSIQALNFSRPSGGVQ